MIFCAPLNLPHPASHMTLSKRMGEATQKGLGL